MKSTNETSDKSIIFRYHKKPTMREQGFDNEAPICPYCQKPKRQMGRFWICKNCTGRQIYTKSGLPVKKSLKNSP